MKSTNCSQISTGISMMEVFLVLADFVANTVSEIRHEATSSYIINQDQWADLLAAYKLKIVECIEVSEPICNFLYDPDAEANLALLTKRVRDNGSIASHFASYDRMARMFTKKLCRYVLLTVQKDRYVTQEAIADNNRDKLGKPRPYGEAAGWVATDTAKRLVKTPNFSGVEATAQDWVFEIEWKMSPYANPPVAFSDQHSNWLILADESGVGEALAKKMSSLGHKHVVVYKRTHVRGFG
jgi:hypothetical protein